MSVLLNTAESISGQARFSYFVSVPTIQMEAATEWGIFYFITIVFLCEQTIHVEAVSQMCDLADGERFLPS